MFKFPKLWGKDASSAASEKNQPQQLASTRSSKSKAPPFELPLTPRAQNQLDATKSVTSIINYNQNKYQSETHIVYATPEISRASSSNEDDIPDLEYCDEEEDFNNKLPPQPTKVSTEISPTSSFNSSDFHEYNSSLKKHINEDLRKFQDNKHPTENRKILNSSYPDRELDIFTENNGKESPLLFDSGPIFEIKNQNKSIPSKKKSPFACIPKLFHSASKKKEANKNGARPKTIDSKTKSIPKQTDSDKLLESFNNLSFKDRGLSLLEFYQKAQEIIQDKNSDVQESTRALENIQTTKDKLEQEILELNNQKNNLDRAKLKEIRLNQPEKSDLIKSFENSKNQLKNFDNLKNLADLHYKSRQGEIVWKFSKENFTEITGKKQDFLENLDTEIFENKDLSRNAGLEKNANDLRTEFNACTDTLNQYNILTNSFTPQQQAIFKKIENFGKPEKSYSFEEIYLELKKERDLLNQSILKEKIAKKPVSEIRLEKIEECKEKIKLLQTIRTAMMPSHHIATNPTRDAYRANTHSMQEYIKNLKNNLLKEEAPEKRRALEKNIAIVENKCVIESTTLPIPLLKSATRCLEDIETKRFILAEEVRTLSKEIAAHEIQEESDKLNLKIKNLSAELKELGSQDIEKEINILQQKILNLNSKYSVKNSESTIENSSTKLFPQTFGDKSIKSISQILTRHLSDSDNKKLIDDWQKLATTASATPITTDVASTSAMHQDYLTLNIEATTSNTNLHIQELKNQQKKLEKRLSEFNQKQIEYNECKNHLKYLPPPSDASMEAEAQERQIRERLKSKEPINESLYNAQLNLKAAQNEEQEAASKMSTVLADIDALNTPDEAIVKVMEEWSLANEKVQSMHFLQQCAEVNAIVDSTKRMPTHMEQIIDQMSQVHNQIENKQKELKNLIQNCIEETAEEQINKLNRALQNAINNRNEIIAKGGQTPQALEEQLQRSRMFIPPINAEQENSAKATSFSEKILSNQVFGIDTIQSEEMAKKIINDQPGFYNQDWDKSLHIQLDRLNKSLKKRPSSNDTLSREIALEIASHSAALISQKNKSNAALALEALASLKIEELLAYEPISLINVTSANSQTNETNGNKPTPLQRGHALAHMLLELPRGEEVLDALLQNEQWQKNPETIIAMRVFIHANARLERVHASAAEKAWLEQARDGARQVLQNGGGNIHDARQHVSFQALSRKLYLDNPESPYQWGSEKIRELHTQNLIHQIHNIPIINIYSGTDETIQQNRLTGKGFSASNHKENVGSKSAQALRALELATNKFPPDSEIALTQQLLRELLKVSIETARNQIKIDGTAKKYKMLASVERQKHYHQTSSIVNYAQAFKTIEDRIGLNKIQSNGDINNFWINLKNTTHPIIAAQKLINTKSFSATATSYPGPLILESLLNITVETLGISTSSPTHQVDRAKSNSMLSKNELSKDQTIKKYFLLQKEKIKNSDQNQMLELIIDQHTGSLTIGQNKYTALQTERSKRHVFKTLAIDPIKTNYSETSQNNDNNRQICIQVPRDSYNGLEPGEIAHGILVNLSEWNNYAIVEDLPFSNSLEALAAKYRDIKISIRNGLNVESATEVMPFSSVEKSEHDLLNKNKNPLSPKYIGDDQSDINHREQGGKESFQIFLENGKIVPRISQRIVEFANYGEFITAAKDKKILDGLKNLSPAKGTSPQAKDVTTFIQKAKGSTNYAIVSTLRPELGSKFDGLHALQSIAQKEYEAASIQESLAINQSQQLLQTQKTVKITLDKTIKDLQNKVQVITRDPDSWEIQRLVVGPKQRPLKPRKSLDTKTIATIAATQAMPAKAAVYPETTPGKERSITGKISRKLSHTFASKKP